MADAPSPTGETPGSPAVGSPWSSFHSSLKLPGRVPGTPVRQTPVLLSSLNPAPPVPSLTPPNPPAAVQELKQHFITLDFLIEYKLLYLNCPKGVYVLPSSKSLHEWHGVIFVQSGPFQSGVFRFTMYIPDGFPYLQPMVRFHSRVFHPYVHASNGALNLLRGLPPWEPNVHHIWHIVQYIADCFYKEETWEESDHQQFLDQAKTCVQESCDNIYDPSIDEEGNMIRFKTMEDGWYQKALATLINGGLPQPEADDKPPGMLDTVKERVRQMWDHMGIT